MSVGKSHNPTYLSCSLILTHRLKQERWPHGPGGWDGVTGQGSSMDPVGSSGLGRSPGSKFRGSRMSQVSRCPPPRFGTLVLPRGGAGVQGTGDSLELQELAHPIGTFLSTLA